jgi:hypothetical protein
MSFGRNTFQGCSIEDAGGYELVLTREGKHNARNGTKPE